MLRCKGETVRNFSFARRCARVMLLGLALLLAQRATAFPNAYVADQAGHINVIDVATNRVVDTIQLAYFSNDVVVSPDGQWIYAVNYPSSVAVIEAFNDNIVAGIAVGNYPNALAISPDGYLLYVGNSGDNTVSVIDTAGLSVVATVPVGKNPNALAVSPDGRRVYVVGNQSNNVSVIDTRSNAVVSTFAVGNEPISIAVSPDSSSIWVGNGGDNTVYVVDAETNALIGTVSLIHNGEPITVAFSPDGTKVFIATADSPANAITIVNPVTYAVTGQISLPGISHEGIAFSPDGSAMYVAGQDTNAVYAISVSGQAVLATVNLSSPPMAVAGFVGGSAPPAQNFTLTATAGVGGSVFSSPPGIYCNTYSTACAQSATYAPGTVVTLTAVPDANYAFAGWGGDCNGLTTCTLTMNATHNASAVFPMTSGPAYLFSIQQYSYTGMSLTSSPAGINCPPTCEALFPANTNISLTTSLSPGYNNFQLQGPGYFCSNVTTPCEIMLQASVALTVTDFAEPQYDFLNVSTVGSGTVTTSPAGINCTGIPYVTCSAGFTAGTSVTATASPSPGYTFTGWTGDCSSTVACVLTMSQQHVVTAVFSPIFPDAGYWWNPAEPGRGYNIEQQGENIFMAAFLYDASGRATWWGAGPAPLTNGTFTTNLFAATGGPQLTGPYTPITGTLQSGPITITFTSPTTGTATFGGNTVPIERFGFGPGGFAPLQAPGAPETGWWWAATEPGRGFAIEVQDTTMFIAGYMYDSAGNPIWYASGPTPMTSATSYAGTWTQFANGETLSGPWKAAQVANADAGNISVVFVSSNSGMLTFPDGRTVPITRFKF
jgi:uncharacterized repeat protein (TIGR02543 family)